MGRESMGVVTGLAVLITGVVAVVSLIGSAGDSAVEDLDIPAVPVAAPDSTAATVEGLPEVGAAVGRVLLWSGNIQLAGPKQLAHLPRSVATVLIQYGVPLRIPATPGQRK